jgi:hypothetical protein
MAAGSWNKTTSAGTGVPGLKDMTAVYGHLEFTSTDVTIEVDVSPLSKIMGMHSFRVGAVDIGNAGYLSISETYTSGVVTVDADQEVTIVRQAVTSTAATAAEEHMVVFYGVDL